MLLNKKKVKNASSLLHFVDSKNDLIKNMENTEMQFQKKNLYLRELILNGRNYVYYKFNGEDRFLPSRYVGYKNISVVKHSEAKHSEENVLDGKETDKVLSSILGKKESSYKFKNLLDAFILKMYGNKYSSNEHKHSFWTTNISLNSSSINEDDELNRACLKELESDSDETSIKNEQIRLLYSSTKTKKQTKYIYYKGKRYSRNSAIRKLALLRADDGKCEACRHEAPFIDKNGEPFLEVHHIIPLSLNGEDELDNVAALCPNCHRKMHYGCSLSISGMKFRLYKYLPKANKKLAKIAEGK